jgi:hypothetical protein
MRKGDICAGLMVLWLIPGCGAEGLGDDELLDDEAVLGEAESSLLQGNALALNALALNALALNTLSQNALALNGLDSTSLAALQDPGSNGTLARSFARYAAGCALKTSQKFTFSWQDSAGITHNESYPGELGIFPNWATGPLNDYGQRMVSACVAARVNWYETPVTISIRSLQEPLKTAVGSKELSSYPDVEGAFWGNLWGSSPFIHACYNSATVANSRSHKRDCAAGHLNADGSVSECGMIDIVGPCSQFCQGLSGAGQYYPSCVEKPGINSNSTQLVITTALP